MKYLVLFLIIWNLITLFMMLIDKKRAKKRQWRISERVLIGSAFFFGAPGIFFGMYAFRHKTKHIKFTVLVPLALCLNAAAVWLICFCVR